MADPEGVQGVRLNPLLESKLLHFHGELWENVGKMVKSNPPLQIRNSQSKIPGSTPGICEPPHDKTNKMACAPSEDSDQPGHLPRLISLHCRHDDTLGP